MFYSVECKTSRNCIDDKNQKFENILDRFCNALTVMNSPHIFSTMLHLMWKSAHTTLLNWTEQSEQN